MDVERIVEEVRRGEGYRSIEAGFVRGIAQAEAAKGRSYKETVKAVKNKLHQVGGAYQPGKMQYAVWLEELRGVLGTRDMGEIKRACARIMEFHSSTRERLGILDLYYQKIFEIVPRPRTILDVACGLNPLALPWMELPDGVHYTAVDIYEDMMKFIEGFLEAAGVRGQAITANVVELLEEISSGFSTESPVEFHANQTVDLALVLKTIPCLEQVDKLAGKKLLDTIDAQHLVVSFPARSLGGRSKGMEMNYREHFHELIEGRGWKVSEILFKNELVFVIEK